MSESLNWPAIGLWTVLASFQIGTAIRDIRNKWRQRRLSRPSTDYERVIDGGEQINGWKIAIPPVSFERHIGPCPWRYAFVSPRWTMNKGDLTNFSRYSQLLCFKRTLRMNDRGVLHVNRFSFLTSNAHAWIMRVTYNIWDWDVENVHYMTDRLLVVVFRNNERPIFHLTLLDVVTGSNRIVVINSPMQDENGIPALVMVFLSHLQGHMNVLFGGRSWRNDEMEQLDYEITIASYDLANSGTIEAPIKASSWQSIAIPMGEKNYIWKSVSPDLLVLHVYQEATDIENIRTFIFSEGTWHVDSLSSWLSSFRATSHGAKWINAVNAFGALSPPSSIQGQIPPLRYARRVSGFTIDGAVFCRPPHDTGILQRSLSPHSLKRLAAEAFCKANPKFDFADLKSMIGFDVFDGIYDDKEPLLIHL